MPVTHLTDIVVSRLREPGTYFDETTPAFAIRVGKNRKTWFVIRGRERGRTTIGKYPAIGLADARKEAKRLLSEEPEKHSKITLSEAYEGYKEAIRTRKPRTQRDYRRVIEKYVLPKFGSKKLTSLDYLDFTTNTDKLKPYEKSHTLAVARAFMRWCVRPPRRYIRHSPLEGIEIEPGKPRKRTLKSDELKIVWHAAAREGYPYGSIVHLLILTGQRKSEIANLRWTWIDEQQRTITLPEWVCKNSREHTFPYGDMLAEVLLTIPRRNSTDLLFPSVASDERPFSGWSKCRERLNDGLPHWVLHDLRRTFGTKLADLDVEPHIVERLLNHTMGSIGNRADSVVSAVAEVYNLARYLPKMRSAIQKNWEPYLRIFNESA